MEQREAKPLTDNKFVGDDEKFDSFTMHVAIQYGCDNKEQFWPDGAQLTKVMKTNYDGWNDAAACSHDSGDSDGHCD